MKFKCSKCGHIYEGHQDKCPSCGAVFVKKDAPSEQKVSEPSLAKQGNKKNVPGMIFNIVSIILVATAALFLLFNILFTTIPFETSYSWYSRSLISRDEALGILTVVFSGIGLLLTPFAIAFRKKAPINFLHAFFLAAAGGLALAIGIANEGCFQDSQEILLIVYGGIEIAFAIALVPISILKIVFKGPKSSSNKQALKSLDVLKKEGLLSEEDYQAKKEQLKMEEKQDPNICPQCGHKKSPKDKFCASCGYKFEANAVSTELHSEPSALTQIAQVFFYIGAIITCCTVIGLCWALPMIHIYKRDRDTVGKHSIAFKICTLLFVSEIAGVLMLIDYKH